MRKTKKFKLGKFGKIVKTPHHWEWTRNHSLDVFNKSLFAEMFPLPGLGSVDCCQYILCVVNRRLHYARVVWVVNQYACFGKLQGNVEHLRKATGLHRTVGSQKIMAWIRKMFNGVHLAEWPRALVFVLLLWDKVTQDIFCFVFLVRVDGQRSQK